MADDLVGDWWQTEDVEVDDDEGDANNEHADSKDNISKNKKKQKLELSGEVTQNVDGNITSKKKKKKEKKVNHAEASEENDGEIKKKKIKQKRKLDNNNSESDAVVKPTSKKKRKKRKHCIEEEEYQPTLEALWKFFQEELEKTLSTIEIKDIKPDNNDWYLMESEPIRRDDSKQFPLYLKNIVPSWEKSCSFLTKKRMKGSPVMLMLTSSAQRAVDLLRHASSFKGENCKTVKLFAKHFKVDDQVKYLEENVVHLAVGTPHRILTLLDNGSLKFKKLKYLIVDWSWKDVKTRRIFNMPNVKDDFVLLFQKYFFMQCQEGMLSVGLF